MPLLAALWLALLHLLSATPAPRIAGAAAALVRGTETTLSRRGPASGDEALRVPRPLPALGAVRPDAPLPHASAADGAVPVCWSGATIAPAVEQAPAWHPSHAPSARGGLLGYFPTAPPLQG